MPELENAPVILDVTADLTATPRRFLRVSVEQ